MQVSRGKNGNLGDFYPILSKEVTNYPLRVMQLTANQSART